MAKATFQVVVSSKGSGFYDLLENGSCLCTFNRSNFRERLEVLGRGSNWIGSILRIFNKKFPVPPCAPSGRGIDSGSNGALIEYLRAKGFRVYRSSSFSDVEIVLHLEQHGYLIEGILEGEFYSSELSTVGGRL